MRTVDYSSTKQYMLCALGLWIQKRKTIVLSEVPVKPSVSLVKDLVNSNFVYQYILLYYLWINLCGKYEIGLAFEY